MKFTVLTPRLVLYSHANLKRPYQPTYKPTKFSFTSNLVKKQTTSMEALEQKWKRTTHQPILLPLCTCFAIFVLCTAMVFKIKTRRKQVMDHGTIEVSSKDEKWFEPSCNWANCVPIRRALVGSVRWSCAKRWEEGNFGGGWREKKTPLLGLENSREDGIGRLSYNPVSPVWQRPILMGERCQLPRFSGLILYDDKGRLLDHSAKRTRLKNNNTHQVSSPWVHNLYKSLGFFFLH